MELEEWINKGWELNNDKTIEIMNGENNSKWFRDKFDRLSGRNETKSEELRRRYCDLYSDVYFKDVTKRIEDYERRNWDKLKK